MKFEIEQIDEYLISCSGLSLVGMLLPGTNLSKRLNKIPVPHMKNPQISNSECVISYLGLLCQGKNDFDHIEAYRDDQFFQISLGLEKVPSSPTLRQRFDLAGNLWNQIIMEESARMLKIAGAAITPSIRDLIPLDIDVSPFDNSHTKKEGVSRTYKGHDGYAPIFAYLGQEGYCINTELREGKDHSQKNTEEFLEKSIRYARMITGRPLLIRMDSGNDSLDNIKVMLKPETQADFIIKRNLRKESPEDWLATAKQHGICCLEREGKNVYMGAIEITRDGLPLRTVFKVVERTIKANGQILLTPEIEVETYWTSLTDPACKIIELYHEHGLSEQFHSEIKNDMDLERLPSGKFATNNLVLHLGVMAYNILRLVGQESLKKPDSPLKKKAQRRRIRTVIQNLITLASRLIHHARKYRLGFGRHSPWFYTFKRIYHDFAVLNP
jgi:hypothetical protein